ncbi:PF20097 family protein [Oscillibacter sp. GMB15532]|uniref:PF20097 family protein n=1 Tax=Oscillibacter sp. GMB15532 TaxID=3230022 RepID=UPI0034DF7492
MAFWNRDEESDWEKHQRSREKETPKREKNAVSDEFKAYFKAVRQGLRAEDGYARQPGEKDTPMKTFLSRLRRDKPEEDEGPPEKCPWCGGDMVKGYLWGGRGIYWQEKKPGFFSSGFSAETVDVSEPGDFGCQYKIMWHCEACRKMVTDIQNLNPPLGERKPEEHSLSYDEQISVAEHRDGEAEAAANETKEEN